MPNTTLVNMNNDKTQQAHIVIIPTPGVGHLIPLTELARRLTEFNFTITILIPNDGTPPSKSQLTLLKNLPSSISHHFLPPVDFSDIATNAAIETRISLTLTRSIPAIRDSLRVLAESTRLVALVVDLFGPPIFGLAREFGILPYMFFLSNALGLCFGLSFSKKIDEVYKCEYRDLSEPVQLFPGSVFIYGADFPDPAQDRKKEVYKHFLEMVGGFGKAAGIFVNSFLELEPTTFKYLMEDGRQENNFPPIYHIGPVIRTGLESELEGLGILDWLNEQPSNSVLFVSFGSGGHLSREQLVELALGLELSRQRFLWVVKTPHDQVNASYFGIKNGHSPLEYLPQGFIDRTKGLGLVVPSWAPQVEILSHKSIGGFVSHCGWNSILESIVHGVPLIAWPLYAEQRLNALLVAEELHIALRVKPNEKGLIGREQIAQYAKYLIVCEQGKVLREKMGDLKNAANVALNNGGSSKQSLTKAAEILMNHNL